MGKTVIINALPRAPKSKSRRYAQLLAQHCPTPTQYLEARPTNYPALRSAIEEAEGVVLVFPLYADSIPATLLNFLKHLQQNPTFNKPAVSVLVNCGFIEPRQNNVAVQQVQLFCSQCGYPFGAVLKVGSGEVILDTPFKGLVEAKVKQFATAIATGQSAEYQVCMPLPKRVFLAAAKRYWLQRGRQNGLTRQQMKTQQIE